ncbi:MAG: hypothetical protein L0Z07_08765, partial [Planctomycetes bacterium]|nr:hypothetical protein [Planctomycetota bacterium]
TLPSGHEEPLTHKDGLSSLRHLKKALDDAAAAGDAVPGLQAELARANREYQAARDTAAFQRQLGRLWIGEAGIPAIARHIAVLERQLALAQALSTQLAAIQDDWRAINEVATYGTAIAGLGTVYVNIHNDDESFAADVR